MSMKYVIIHHGIVESFNLGYEHKPQLVFGLRDALRRMGYRVDLHPVEYINYCLLEVCGHEIFRCNLKNLAFNKSYERDPVCELALQAVERSTEKFNRTRSWLWLREFIKEQVFLNPENACKDIWISDTESIGEIADPITCADCCGIIRKTDTSARQFSHKTKDDMLFDSISKAFSRDSDELSSVDIQLAMRIDEDIEEEHKFTEINSELTIITELSDI